MRVLLFIVPMLVVTVGVHVYLYRRLIRGPELPRHWRRRATIALVALALNVPASFVLVRTLRTSYAAPAAWVAYVWMGLLMFFFFSLLALDVLLLVRKASRHLAAQAPDEPDRRRFLSRASAGVATALTSGLAGFSTWRAQSGPVLRRVPVRISRIPPGLHGFRIAQITDVHIGPTIGPDYLREVVRRVNELDPHVIAITGDLVDGTVAQLADAIAPLADLRAHYGVFFVTGNHEYFYGAEDWVEHLPRLGVRPLQNERAVVHHRGALIDIAGIHDWSSPRMATSHRPDIAAAVAGRDTSRPLVLLSHQPRSIHEAARHGVDLQLSGHTHGGQIFPWRYLVKLQQPYVSGLHTHGRTQIYVSMGTGYWGPPMRLGTECEITLIELV